MSFNPRHNLVFLASVALLAMAMLFLGACPNGVKECPPCDENEICDEETGECITDPDYENDEPQPCVSDFDDCEEGEVCDLESGECVPGIECNPNVAGAATNAECNYAPGSYEEEPGYGCGGTRRDDCICDPTDNTCKRRRQLCEPCTDDEECGPHSHFGTPAECVAYDDGTFCLAVTSASACPTGYRQDGDHCVPNTGTCAEYFACTSDAECPEDRPICDRLRGQCVELCVYDFLTGESVGCPPAQVCHGDGRCRGECEDNETCQDIDPSFICFEEPRRSMPDGSYNEAAWRCRIEDCLHDSECDVPAEGPYLGFCDLNVNECYDDRCYQGDFQGEAHEDPNRHCRDGFACRDTGICERMACTERAAPSIACSHHQECCGFCRNINDNPDRDACDPTPCPDEIETPPEDAEGCFFVDKDKWCSFCEPPPDCVDTVEPPQGPQDQLTYTAAMLACEGSVCGDIENPAGDARDSHLCLGICLLTCETPVDCPVGWGCNAIPLQCQTHDQCGVGGQCARLDPEDEDAPRYCLCEGDDGADDDLCPEGLRCLRHSQDYFCGLGSYCSEQIPEDGVSYCEE